MKTEMQTHLMTSVAPEVYIYVTYDGDWPGERWPGAEEEITVVMDKFPVIGMFCAVPVDTGFLPQVSAVILEEGNIRVVEKTPLDWGEDSVHLGVYAKGVEESELQAAARKRCWSRMTQQRRREEREAKQ